MGVVWFGVPGLVLFYYDGRRLWLLLFLRGIRDMRRTKDLRCFRRWVLARSSA